MDVSAAPVLSNSSLSLGSEWSTKSELDVGAVTIATLAKTNADESNVGASTAPTLSVSEPVVSQADNTLPSEPVIYDDPLNPSSMAQINSISQLSDVQPTDWAYEALSFLVTQYNCLEGYPDGTFRADLTGGSVTVPVPPGIGLAGSTGGDSGGTPVIFSPSSIFIAFFLSSETDFTIFTPGEMGDFHGTPVMPGATLIGIFVFTSVPSGVWVDPPMVVSQAQTTFGFDFVMTPRPVPVGVASRVFPGMVGVGAASDATFTAITGLPEGIDADDRHTVSVGDVVVGEFSPGDTVRFSDYQEALGDRLIDGEGVTQFQINGIEPGVDSSDPTAFPVRLEYGTPTASFEMRASTPTLAGATEVPAVSSNAVEETIPVAEPSVPTIDLLEQNGNCFNDSDKDCSVNS